MQLVLVITPDPSTIEKIEYYLTGQRLRVVSTTQNKRGLDYAKSSVPDLLVLGLNPQDKEIKEILSSIRKDPITHDVTVLGIYRKLDEIFIQQMRRDGVSDYLCEPLDKGEFLLKVFDLMEITKTNKESEISHRKEHIQIDHPASGLSRISFHSGLKKYVAPEIKNIFKKEFFESTLKDIICLDIRSLPEPTDEELDLLGKIIKLFGKKRINIIAGKNLGIILTNTELEDVANLFMSPEEFDELYSKDLLEI